MRNQAEPFTADPRIEDGYGITTGTCAAAVAAAAVRYLTAGECLGRETVALPSGGQLSIPISFLTGSDGRSIFQATKYAGNDPDITDGVVIQATAHEGRVSGLPEAFDPSESDSVESSIKVVGGVGIGTVFLPGLQIPPGHAAINPVPLKMIKKSVGELTDGPVCVELSIPAGEELARRTFNPRLGIIGGLSILGTSGLVRPMSDKAFLASLIPALSVAEAAGHKAIYLCFGNIGRTAVLRLAPKQTAVVQTSNFIAHMVQEAGKRRFTHLTVVGHLGKLAKVAAGATNTHHRRFPLDMGRLVESLRLPAGVSPGKLRNIVSAEGLIHLLRAEGALGALEPIAHAARANLSRYLPAEKNLAVMIIDMKGDVVSISG